MRPRARMMLRISDARLEKFVDALTAWFDVLSLPLSEPGVASLRGIRAVTERSNGYLPPAFS
jgi:hypothetical protein